MSFFSTPQMMNERSVAAALQNGRQLIINDDRKRRNRERADRGLSMLEHYSATVLRADDPEAHLTDDMYAEPDEVLRDLLLDLMHFAAGRRIDFLDVQAQAQMAFSQERHG